MTISPDGKLTEADEPMYDIINQKSQTKNHIYLSAPLYHIPNSSSYGNTGIFLGIINASRSKATSQIYIDWSNHEAYSSLAKLRRCISLSIHADDNLVNPVRPGIVPASICKS